MFDYKKVLRTVQVTHPGISDWKYFVQYNIRKVISRPFESDFQFLKYFRPASDTVFLDIGANRGQSVQAIRIFNTVNPIHCFEPSSKTFSVLERYIRDQSRVVLHKIALSDIESEVILYTPIYRGYVFDGLASTVLAEAEKWLRDRIYFFNPRHLNIASETVPVATLDSLQLKPSFIKIDVQGGEFRVLKGGAKTIEEHKPILLIESPGKEITYLKTFGYEHYSWRNGALQKQETGRSNTFLIPPERLVELDAITIVHR